MLVPCNNLCHRTKHTLTRRPLSVSILPPCKTGLKFIETPINKTPKTKTAVKSTQRSEVNCTKSESEAFHGAFVAAKIMAIIKDSSSILPFIPLFREGTSFNWPPNAIGALKALSRGPSCSEVDSGEKLYDSIIDLRHEVGLAGEPLARFAEKGYCLFFDDLIPRADSRKWFGEIVPSLAGLMLRLPVMMESHFKDANNNIHTSEESNSQKKELSVMETCLRILHPQQPGIVLLSQELIAALLGCALFCLFPSGQRRLSLLPAINFDGLFAGLCTTGESQEHKVKCIVHYFERICSRMPHGVVSFERKVLPVEDNGFPILYPSHSLWSESKMSLCTFKVMETGAIEDHEEEALEVDFANEYLGGGALNNGCVQEEIRFMINPELIIGMLFLPSMENNEAIEIVGAERFSKYKGYASGFHFAGDYVDERCRDIYGRRQTRIVAIDALCYPGLRQFTVSNLIREVNKAFCGFLDHAKIRGYFQFLTKMTINTEQFEWGGICPKNEAENGMVDTQQDSDLLALGDGECSSSGHNPSSKQQTENAEPFVPTDQPGNDIAERTNLGRGLNEAQDLYLLPSQENVGIATGNWGCGVFGGDLELKSMLQWLAASQASRPFVLYFTFGEEFSKRLKEITEWIRHHSWTVGELWDMLLEYSSQRLRGKTYDSFFQWVLPQLDGVCPMHEASTKGQPMCACKIL